MKKDYLIIVNPKAGSGRTEKFLPRIKSSAEKSDFSFDILLTKKRGDATVFSREKLSKYENYLVVGGDGTLNEVINGVDANLELPRLGVLPLGSGNDFGKFLHKGRKIKDIIARYFSGKTDSLSSDFCEAELSEPDGKLVRFQFVNALGIGFDSFVAKENLDNKTFTGLTAYVLSVLKSLKKFNGVKAEVSVDGERITNGEALLLVTIGNNKTSGGGFYLNPFADVNDGMLDITTIKHLSVPQILKNLPLTLINKTETVRGFRHYNGKKIQVELSSPFIVHADGEIFSTKAKSVSVKIFDKKIKLIA